MSIKLMEKVVNMLLDGDDPVLEILRKQYKAAEIVKQEKSVSGFFIDFQVNDYCIDSELYKTTFQLGDVNGNIDEIDNAVGFILYIKNGAIILFEGYTNIIDKWPKDDKYIKLSYDSGNERNIALIKNKWIKST